VKKISTAFIFEAAVSREAAERKLIDDLLGLFGGRTRAIIAHLIESGSFTLEDVSEAETLLLGRNIVRCPIINKIGPAGRFNFGLCT
jgi:hypothetical protein